MTQNRKADNVELSNGIQANGTQANGTPLAPIPEIDLGALQLSSNKLTEPEARAQVWRKKVRHQDRSAILAILPDCMHISKDNLVRYKRGQSPHQVKAGTRNIKDYTPDNKGKKYLTPKRLREYYREVLEMEDSIEIDGKTYNGKLGEIIAKSHATLIKRAIKGMEREAKRNGGSDNSPEKLAKVSRLFQDFADVLGEKNLPDSDSAGHQSGTTNINTLIQIIQPMIQRYQEPEEADLITE